MPQEQVELTTINDWKRVAFEQHPAGCFCMEGKINGQDFVTGIIINIEPNGDGKYVTDMDGSKYLLPYATQAK